MKIGVIPTKFDEVSMKFQRVSTKFRRRQVPFYEVSLKIGVPKGQSRLPVDGTQHWHFDHASGNRTFARALPRLKVVAAAEDWQTPAATMKVAILRPLGNPGSLKSLQMCDFETH